MTDKELEKLKADINRILDGTDYPSSKDKMLSVSKYYLYMSESIASEKILINCDKDLLISFEAIYLWLQEKLSYLPSHLNEQVKTIFSDAKLCDLFAILSSLGNDEIKYINRRRRINSSFGIMTSLFSSLSHSEVEELQLVSQSSLLNAKIALTRLHQVTKFSASKIEREFYSNDGLDAFSSRYNPEIINKSRIVALVNLLKSQYEEVEQNDDTKLILEKLEKVEEEINKRKPHWGLIFSTIFVIFGFTADLKTLSPEIYTKPLKTIESILIYLHEEGQVENNTLLKLQDEKKKPIPDRLALFKREDPEIETE